MHSNGSPLPSPRRGPPHVATLILLSGASALGMNVFLPSLPNMAAHFDTSYRMVQLSVTLYLAMNAALQILMGPIADKAGRRPVILWGIVLFLIATLGCLVAPNIYVFLFFRMGQAVIAVGMVLSRAAVRDMYDQDRAASMLGYVTMGVAVVPLLAPPLGGVLDSLFGWKANFWLLFIVGILGLLLTYADFGETALKSGKTLGAQFREYPELLRSPRFWGYSLACGLSSGAFFAYLGGAPYVGVEIFGMPAGRLGLFLGSPAAGYFLGNWLSGVFSTRIGINRMVLWGCWVNLLGVALSVAAMLAGLGSEYTFFGFMVLVGIGNGMAIPNATSGALSVRPHLAGTAAGLSGAIMLAGGAALSGMSSLILKPGTGAMPLLLLMLATAVLALVSILLVIRRERQLGI